MEAQQSVLEPTTTGKKTDMEAQKSVPEPTTTKKNLDFWLVYLSLALNMFIATLDLTVVSSAIPTIARELNDGWFRDEFPRIQVIIDN